MRGGSSRLGSDVSGPLCRFNRFECSPNSQPSCHEVYEGWPMSLTSYSFFYIPNLIESHHTRRSTPS
jgi:hypothetical protein